MNDSDTEVGDSSNTVGTFPQDSTAGKWYSKLQDVLLQWPLTTEYQEDDCPFCFEGISRRKIIRTDGVNPARGNIASFRKFLACDPTKILISECKSRSTLECLGSSTRFTSFFCNAESCIIRLFKKWVRYDSRIFDSASLKCNRSFESSRKAATSSSVSFQKLPRNFKTSHNRALVRRMKSVDELHQTLPHEEDESTNERVFRPEARVLSRRFVRGSIMDYWLSKVQQQIVTSQPYTDSFCPFCYATDGGGRIGLSDSKRPLSVLSFAKFVNEDSTGILREECSRRGTIAAFRNLGVNLSFLDFCNQRWCLKRVYRKYHRRKIVNPDLDFFKMCKVRDVNYGSYDVMTLVNGTTITSNRDLARVRLPIDNDQVNVRYAYEKLNLLP